MTRTRFVAVNYPRRMVADRSPRQPRRYYVALMNDLFRCSLPASRRLGWLYAVVARHDGIRLLLPAVLAVSRCHSAPDLDRLRIDLAEHWTDLARLSARLPREPPDLSLLSLRRSRGSLILVFGEAETPLLACKITDAGENRGNEESNVLSLVADLGLAPRHLGLRQGVHIEEGLPGRPMRIMPLRPGDAARTDWDEILANAAHLLLSLGVLSQGPGTEPVPLPRAARILVSPAVVARVQESQARLRTADVSVTCHGDMSPQNVLVSDGAVSGFVDWERTRRGLPGTDVLTLVQSVFEQRLGLRRWRGPEVLSAFAAAWDSAPLFLRGRRAAQDAAAAVGIPESLVPDLEVAFFARRLQRRADRPADPTLGPELAAGMLERVCAR